jgi:hypothetical protein
VEIIEIVGELLIALLDGGALLGDVISWIKGRENRIKRRDARNRGEAVPPRDGWNWAVILLSLAVVVLTAVLIVGLK